MCCEKCEERQSKEEILKTMTERRASIQKFAEQLKDCLEEMKEHSEKMIDELQRCDIYKDSNDILVHLKTIMDYAMIEETNINTILRTIEIILREMYWTRG